jgi:hypothetical protein
MSQPEGPVPVPCQRCNSWRALFYLSNVNPRRPLLSDHCESPVELCGAAGRGNGLLPLVGMV